MNISDLKLLLKIAELGNISRAAEALGLSQSVASRNLRELERSFESPLFHRTGRGVVPTDIGALAVDRARELVRDFDNFIVEIKDMAREPSGVVTIALLSAYMREFAVDLFELVKRQYPRILLRMVESFSVQHEGWLADGQVDIALVTQYHAHRVKNDDIVSASDLMIIGRPELLPDRPDISFRELTNRELVLPAPQNGLRQRLEEEACEQGIPLKVIFEADSLGAQLELLRRYPCCAVWSEHLVQLSGHHKELRSCRIIKPTLPRYVVLRTTTHHPLTRAMREVAHLLRRLILEAHGSRYVPRADMDLDDE